MAKGREGSQCVRVGCLRLWAGRRALLPKRAPRPPSRLLAAPVVRGVGACLVCRLYGRVVAAAPPTIASWSCLS